MRSSDHKQTALYTLTGKWGIAVLAALIAGMLGGLIASSNIDFNIDADDLSFLSERALQILRWILPAAGGLGFVQLILGGTVQLGYSRFLLNMHDGREATVGDLFSDFHRFGTGFCQAFLRGLYIFLWSLLFIIPGIIASLKYAMTPFILADHPYMTASEAIDASKEMMDGHKLDLFLLDLSFIGWALLNILTLGIGSLWLNPYMNAAFASFYRSISGMPQSSPYQTTWQT